MQKGGRPHAANAFVRTDDTPKTHLRPKDFLDEVIEKRLPNPFLPDTPQRIATDTAQKLPIRFGETIKAYEAKGLDKE